MTDLRRTILWVVFTMSIFFLWDAWNKHNGQPSMFSPARPAASAASGAASSPVPRPSGQVATVGSSNVGAPAGLGQATPAQSINVTTDVMKVTLSTLGATMTRVELPLHKDKNNPSGHVVVLDTNAAHSYQAQSGLVAASGAPTHLSSFRHIAGPLSLAPGSDSLDVQFESDVVGGLKLIKTYTFKRGHYAVNVKHEVINTGSTTVTPQLYLQLVRDGQLKDGAPAFAPASFTGPAVYTEKSKFQKVEFGDLAKGKAEYEKLAQDGWVAMVQHYFVSAWLEAQGQPREFFMRPLEGGLYAAGLLRALPAVAPQGSVSTQNTLYVGPQDEKVLAALAPGLELVKDYGMLTLLAKPLFWLLDHLHSYIGNWGWAIVALVVLLKIAFYWLNASAYRSMAKMKAVAPRLTALRERHKDEPQKMQQEMMRIYREEKVNPLGGCLPVLAQMPFFIALYWVLLSSVEMRGAPWLGWIQDLSVIDPYFILPTLMILTSLLQTWLNPRPDDPMQAKLMWILPVAFGVMFYFFPAGLVLYWVTNNILSIAQQYLINKQMGVAN
jgi:YidC/Oxa1 family membrane protein insertase